MITISNQTSSPFNGACDGFSEVPKMPSAVRGKVRAKNFSYLNEGLNLGLGLLEDGDAVLRSHDLARGLDGLGWNANPEFSQDRFGRDGGGLALAQGLEARNVARVLFVDSVLKEKALFMSISIDVKQVALSQKG